MFDPSRAIPPGLSTFAGILLALGSSGDALLVDAGTFALSAAFLLRIAARPGGEYFFSPSISGLRQLTA